MHLIPFANGMWIICYLGYIINFVAVLQCGTTLHGEVDRISNLPDEIIAVIFDSLSLREAARTSILSSRWLYLWKHTPILNFDTDIYEFDSPINREMRRVQSRASLWNVERSKCVELVNSVLQSNKAPSLKKFRISFYVNRLGQSHVIKWLEFVFLRGVEALVLNFICDDPKYMVVLEELWRESGLCRPQNLILFKPLKQLCLNHFKVSGEAVKLILRSCPSLEVLSIGSAFFTSDVEVCGSKLVLKHLEVYFHRGNRSLKVSAPNLNWLMVDSSSENLLLENLPKLVGAELRFGRHNPHSPNSLQNLTSALFRFSSQLEVLNLSLLCPEVRLPHTS